MLFGVPASPEHARPYNFLRPLLLALVFSAAIPASGNTSGIATAGAPVTVKDNGDGTVTMANGIVSILIEKAANRLNSIAYTTNNSGRPRSIETLQKHEYFRWVAFRWAVRPSSTPSRSIPPPTAAATARSGC